MQPGLSLAVVVVRQALQYVEECSVRRSCLQSLQSEHAMRGRWRVVEGLTSNPTYFFHFTWLRIHFVELKFVVLVLTLGFW